MKQRKKWKELTPRERYERLSWSVATSSAIETGENPQKIYERLMTNSNEINWDLIAEKTESNETY